MLNILVEYLLSIPKSIYVNFKLLSFKDAIKLPILVRWNCKIHSLKGNIILNNIKTGILKIGFGYVGVYDKKYERSILEINGTIELEGKATFGQGSRICIAPMGKLYIGDNFINTAQLTIICYDSITIGKGVLTSWDTLIMDTDFHQSINTISKKLSDYHRPITIGDNVWIGTRSVLLKGCKIPRGCIIGACSLVNQEFNQVNSLIANSVSTIKKENITLYQP